MLNIKRLSEGELKSQRKEPAGFGFFYPFQSLWWGEVFSRHFCQPKDVYLLMVGEQDKPAAWGAFEKVGKKALFLGMKPVLGKEEVTDYGDLIWNTAVKTNKQEVWPAVINYWQKQGVKKLQLDFVRQDSFTYRQLNDLTKKTTIVKQEVAPFIKLLPTWNDYLQGLDRKKRKELRRKIHRLEQENAFHFCQSNTIRRDFNDFIRLHRLSDPAKKKFMSTEMKAFFWDLIKVSKNSWQDRLCFLEMEGKRVASVLSFTNNDKILLYNSGYDPKYGFYSVGLLLKAYLIKKAIENGLKEYDFLRGNERYKHDLGAKNHQLFKIIIPTA